MAKQSKGERRNVSRKNKKLVRRGTTEIEKLTNKTNSWLKGQNPWISINNPNPNETNKKKIRVRANEYWGNPKKPTQAIKVSTEA